MWGKTQRGVSERPKQSKQSLIPKWFGTLILILMVLSAAVALMLWKPWAPVHARSNTNTGQPQGETNKDYRFYDQLPKQQVTPIPDQAVPANQRQEAGVIVEIQKVSRVIAFKVAKAAMDAGVAPVISDELLIENIEKNFWKPEYRQYKRVPF